jgi:hypothetical protein
MTTKIYIIFDLDETIGQFIQLGYFYQGITRYFKKLPTKEEFFLLLEYFKNYFRPNIFKILSYIKLYKEKHKEKLEVLIFTNNQAGIKWVTEIKEFIERKIKYNIFDKIIGPYKIKEEIHEILRTNHVKHYDDLVKFIDCNDNTPILFLDDNFHKEMIRDNIIYLLIEPYEFQYKINDMINIYLSNNDNIDKNNFTLFITNYMNTKIYKKNKSEISKKDYKMSDIILKHIHNFLTLNLKKNNVNKTLKKTKLNFNKTKKIRLNNYKL